MELVQNSTAKDVQSPRPSLRISATRDERGALRSLIAEAAEQYSCARRYNGPLIIFELYGARTFECGLPPAEYEIALYEFALDFECRLTHNLLGTT